MLSAKDSCTSTRPKLGCFYVCNYVMLSCILLLLLPILSNARNPLVSSRILHASLQSSRETQRFSLSTIQLFSAAQWPSSEHSELSESVDLNPLPDPNEKQEQSTIDKEGVNHDDVPTQEGKDSLANQQEEIEKDPIEGSSNDVPETQSNPESEDEFSGLDTGFELSSDSSGEKENAEAVETVNVLGDDDIIAEPKSESETVETDAVLDSDEAELDIDDESSFTGLDTFPEPEASQEVVKPDEVGEETVEVNKSVAMSQSIHMNNNADSIVDLFAKYKNRIVMVNVSQFPHCEIYLCGTLHVSASSVEMVKEAIDVLCPHFVVLELCDGRLEGLIEDDTVNENITLAQVVQSAVHDRSIKTFGMGLLTWMQVKAAKTMGSKLGGELTIAAKEAHRLQSRLILGDRNYAVTIQRIFDRLSFSEKFKMIAVMIWETLTMSLFKLKDYIHQSQNDENFIADELERFAKYLPNFADVVIRERDEYLSQTIFEIASVGFGRISPTLASAPRSSFERKGKILAVVGAGHLPGIQKHLLNGGVSLARMQEISSSSKHECTWPGCGVLQVVDTNILFQQKP